VIDPAPWLSHLRHHLPIAREGSDPEGVHQVRVAGRRLRVWLELAGLGVLEDDLAWLVRGAAQVRDLEVLLSDRQPEAFARWLRKELEAARAAFVPMLDSPRMAGLLRALSSLPPIPTPEAQARLPRFERRVWRRAAAWSKEDTLEALHDVRRALRRLRYAREWLEHDTDDLKQLQDALGQVGDLSFTLSYLQRFEQEGGRVTSSHKRRLEDSLRQAVEQARQGWREWSRGKEVDGR
jgi:CHAD domain-containing protein